jgi:hypothetical protein
MLLLGIAFDQALHDREGPRLVKVFAIMEKQWKRGQPIGSQRESAIPGA